MQKNKNRISKKALLALASLAFGWALSAGPASAAPGLSIDIQRINSTAAYVKWHGESTSKATRDINFYGAGNNLEVSFGEIMNPAGGNNYPTKFTANGALYIPSAGNYALRLDATGTSHEISIYGNETTICATYGWTSTPDPCSTSQYYDAGWYQIHIYYTPAVTNLDPQIRLSWSVNGGSWGLVPDTRLDSNNWDNTEILIPSSGKQQIDYKIAGVGVDDSNLSGGVKELEFRLPDGITAGDILPDGTQLFWRNGHSTTLRVRNAATSDAAINLNGTRLTSAKGATLEGIRAKLPNNFFANSASDQNIYLSFENLDADVNGDTYADIDGGIDLVVVYKDLTKPNGVLKIKTLGEGVHGSASHVVSFDVSSMDPTNLRPFFLFADAESKTLLSAGTGLPRHNYLAMKASVSQPGEAELFMKGITTAAGEISDPAKKRIIPRLNGEPTLASVDQWYPMFGREGPEADVLSTAQNYAPNLRYGGYISGNSDGVFDTALAPFQIPSGNNWVSFQYAASDFYGDGSAELGSNESSFFFATGLLYYDAAKLLVCPASTTLNVGQTQQLEARYWSSYFGIPDCSTTGYTNVTNSASWSSANASKVSVGASTGLIKAEGVTTSPVTISAAYSSLTAANEVTVTNLCSYNVCNASTNMCESTVGTIPCPSSACTTVGQSCGNFRGNNIWEEVAP